MNVLKRIREAREMNSEDRVREESLEDIGEGDDEQQYMNENSLISQRLDESSQTVLQQLDHHLKKGYDLSHVDISQVDDIENDDEARDIVQNMS